MKNDTFESLVPGPKCSRPKYFWAEAYKWAKVNKRAEIFSGPKLFRAEVFPGRSIPGQSIPGQSISGPKWVSGQSGLWAKLGVSRLSDCLSNCPWMFLPKRQYTRHNIPMYPIRTNQNKYLLLESIILGSIVHHTSCAVQTNWIPFLWLYGTVKLNTFPIVRLSWQFKIADL